MIMIFLTFVPLATIFVATASSENLFSDNSPDISAFQDSPQDPFTSPDLLALQNLPEDSELTTDDNDLFAGSDALGLFSTEPQDSFPGLEASCLTDEGQSLNNLRSRDGVVCSPENPAPLKKEPTQDKLGDIIRKIKEFFQDPPNEGRLGQFLKLVFLVCRPDFPLHMCCDTPGDRTFDISLPGGNIYEYFYGCDPGSWDFFFLLGPGPISREINFRIVFCSY